MKRMENLLIIQARMGSSRLPNKVLRELCGKPMLQCIVERVSSCRQVDSIVVATTIKEEDFAICELCKDIGVTCFQGSEDDVLDRYYRVAERYSPKNVVRITADCPLIDPEIVDEIIAKHIEGDYDYTSNTLVETYPDGLDTEVFKFTVLKEAWQYAELASEREHVTPYIKFRGKYKRFSVERTPSLSEKRWTVDTEKDFQVISQIYEALYMNNKIFLTGDILAYLKENEEVESINANIVRNEGYKKSLQNDYVVGKKD